MAMDDLILQNFHYYNIRKQSFWQQCLTNLHNKEVMHSNEYNAIIHKDVSTMNMGVLKV